MKITIDPVPIEQKSVLRNLLELYKYDFTEFDPEDVNEHGLYGYTYLDHYWTEEGRHVFFVRVDGKLAGFAMVRQLGQTEEGIAIYAMAEYFIMRKYRRSGLGREFAFHLFDRFRGVWRVKQIEENMPARRFWSSIISEYTEGRFEELREPEWDGPIHRFRSC
ncbi:GNAT family N-acetyltransferase [Paenibacillus allorhizosphaerae]|nr:GNAT family N-acetyltransferase [Paenibacillus allorhizosphaerae]